MKLYKHSASSFIVKYYLSVKLKINEWENTKRVKAGILNNYNSKIILVEYSITMIETPYCLYILKVNLYTSITFLKGHITY